MNKKFVKLDNDFYKKRKYLLLNEKGIPISFYKDFFEFSDNYYLKLNKNTKRENSFLSLNEMTSKTYKNIIIFEDMLPINKLLSIKNKEDIIVFPFETLIRKDFYKNKNLFHYKRLSQEIKIKYLSKINIVKDKETNKIYNYYIATIEVVPYYKFYK